MIQLALGAQGSGKTHSLVAACRELFARRWRERLNPRLYIHDTRCYSERPITGFIKAGPSGYCQPRTAGSLVPYGCWFSGPEEFVRAYHASESVKEMTVVGFHACPLVDVFSLGKEHKEAHVPAIIFADELDMLPPILTQHIDAYHVLHYGRRVPVDVFGCARRPQNLDKAWLSEANVVYLHQLREPLALKKIKKSGWLDAELLAEKCKTLQPRERLVINAMPDITG